MDTLFEYLSIDDVSLILKISKKTVIRLIQRGDLTSVKINDRCVRIPKDSLLKYQKIIALQGETNYRKSLQNQLKKNNIKYNHQSQELNLKRSKNFCELRDGYFVVRKQFKGKRYVVYSGRDKDEAKKSLAEFELLKLTDPTALDNQFFDSKKDITFKDYGKRYIEEVCKPMHRALKDDIVRYNALLPFFKTVKLQDISYPLAKQYIVFRKKQYSKTTKNDDGSRRRVSNATVNRELNFMSAVLREALRDGLIERHPLRGMNIKLEEEQVDIHPITDKEDLQNFINYFRTTPKKIVTFAVLTGFRLKTVLNLQKKSFNPEKNEIILLQQHQKSKKWQVFPISEQASAILKGINNNTPYFFPNPRTGKPYYELRKTFKTAVRKAGLHPKTTFHDLRRSFGTILMKQGFPLKTISKAMSHSSISVTEKYLRVSEDRDIRPMVNSLADFYMEKDEKEDSDASEKVATKVVTLIK